VAEPAAPDKFAPPEYRDLKADLIPRVRVPGGRVGVISGHFGLVAGPTQGDYVKMTMLDVELERGFVPPAGGAAATVFVYLVSGAGRFGGMAGETEERRAVLFGAGDEILAQAGEAGVRFILFAGRPLKEPIAWGGPIVMNTREELQQAFGEIEKGTFIRNPEEQHEREDREEAGQATGTAGGGRRLDPPAPDRRSSACWGCILRSAFISGRCGWISRWNAMCVRRPSRTSWKMP
jgi:hypothetical protein